MANSFKLFTKIMTINTICKCLKVNQFRACLIILHSNFEIFQKGNPAVDVMLDRRIFER